jgi:hypothetical protein
VRPRRRDRRPQPVRVTADERERRKSLERENRELRPTTGILRPAAALFGPEYDRRQADDRPSSTRTRTGFGIEFNESLYWAPVWINASFTIKPGARLALLHCPPASASGRLAR